MILARDLGRLWQALVLLMIAADEGQQPHPSFHPRTQKCDTLVHAADIAVEHAAAVIRWSQYK